MASKLWMYKALLGYFIGFSQGAYSAPPPVPYKRSDEFFVSRKISMLREEEPRAVVQNEEEGDDSDFPLPVTWLNYGEGDEITIRVGIENPEYIVLTGAEATSRGLVWYDQNGERWIEHRELTFDGEEGWEQSLGFFHDGEPRSFGYYISPENLAWLNNDVNGQ